MEIEDIEKAEFLMDLRRAFKDIYHDTHASIYFENQIIPNRIWELKELLDKEIKKL